MREILLLEIVITMAAIVTGGFVLLLTLALARVCGWPVSYALIAGAAATLFSWLTWSSRAADILEHMTGAKRKPPQDTTPKEINLRIHEERGEFLEGTFLDRLPVGADTLAALADRALSGDTLSTSAITGYGITRRTWESMRDKFVRAGLLAWRDGSRIRGLEVTPRGKRVFARLAAPYSPTGPDELLSGENAVEIRHTHGT